MKKKGVSQYDLIVKYGVILYSIDVLCNILDCKIEDIAEHIK